MCGKIECYIEAFSKLRTDGNRKTWSTATTFRAPHKPFLLLSVLDLIDAKKINREFIEPFAELADRYACYWQKVMESDIIPDMAMPFYDLDREPFWKLVPQPEAASRPETIQSLTQLKELYLGAKIDDELFKLCLMEPLRRKLQAALMTTYFDPATQQILHDFSAGV